MVATFLSLCNFISFFPLFMYFSCSFLRDFHPNVLCDLDDQLTQTNRCFSRFNGRLCFIPHRRITTWNPGGGGDSAFLRGGDARREFGIKPLKETDLGVAQAFDP